MCYTCTHSLSLRVVLPHCKHHQRLVLQLSALLNNFTAQTGRFIYLFIYFFKVGITGGNAEIFSFCLPAVNSTPAKALHNNTSAHIPLYSSVFFIYCQDFSPKYLNICLLSIKLGLNCLKMLLNTWNYIFFKKNVDAGKKCQRNEFWAVIQQVLEFFTQIV